MTSQFDLTRFYDVILHNSVFQLSFLTREFQIQLNYRSYKICLNRSSKTLAPSEKNISDFYFQSATSIFE